MAERDIKNNLGLVQLLKPQDLAHTTTKSSLLDTRGFQAVALAFIIGTYTGEDVSNYMTPSLEECDTTVDASFAAVAAADLIGTLTAVAATGENAIQIVGYRGSKRYIRAVLTYTGTGITASLNAVTGILSKGDYLPVTAPAAVTAT